MNVWCVVRAIREDRTNRKKTVLVAQFSKLQILVGNSGTTSNMLETACAEGKEMLMVGDMNINLLFASLAAEQM